MAKHDETARMVKMTKNGKFMWHRQETTYWFAKNPLNPYSVYRSELADRYFFLRKKIPFYSIIIYLAS